MVLQFGSAVLSSVFQRPGRNGYYLRVPVPYELRKKLNNNSVVKKLGKTHREAIANRSKIEAEIQRSFGAQLNTLSLVEQVQAAYENVPEFKGLSLGQLPTTDKEKIRDAYPIELDQKGNALNTEQAALWQALDNQTTWQQWANRREATESVAKSTVINWRSKLKALATWAKTDFLAELTKSQAIEYKNYLLAMGQEPSSVKNNIACLNAFWNWGLENEIIKTNVWAGLKKRLPDPDKKPLPPQEVFDAATEKARTTSPWRKTIDYQFLIQRYTGCRMGEAAGLRHCDIDLEKKMVSFWEWEKLVRYKKIRGGKRAEKQIRRFKTGKKDERVLPMSSALYEVLKNMPIKTDSDDPIWPRRYKANNDSWGAHHVSEYKEKYNLLSHDLRRYAVTKLTLEGVSPFIIFEITRQKIEGMSEVISMYTRPSPEELREAMELLI